MDTVLVIEDKLYSRLQNKPNEAAPEQVAGLATRYMHTSTAYSEIVAEAERLHQRGDLRAIVIDLYNFAEESPDLGTDFGAQFAARGVPVVLWSSLAEAYEVDALEISRDPLWGCTEKSTTPSGIAHELDSLVTAALTGSNAELENAGLFPVSRMRDLRLAELSKLIHDLQSRLGAPRLDLQLIQSCSDGQRESVCNEIYEAAFGASGYLASPRDGVSTLSQLRNLAAKEVLDPERFSSDMRKELRRRSETFKTDLPTADQLKDWLLDFVDKADKVIDFLEETREGFRQESR